MQVWGNLKVSETFLLAVKYPLGYWIWRVGCVVQVTENDWLDGEKVLHVNFSNRYLKVKKKSYYSLVTLMALEVQKYWNT